MRHLSGMCEFSSNSSRNVLGEFVTIGITAPFDGIAELLQVLRPRVTAPDRPADRSVTAEHQTRRCRFRGQQHAAAGRGDIRQGQSTDRRRPTHDLPLDRSWLPVQRVKFRRQSRCGPRNCSLKNAITVSGGIVTRPLSNAGVNRIGPPVVKIQR